MRAEPRAILTADGWWVRGDSDHRPGDLIRTPSGLSTVVQVAHARRNIRVERNRPEVPPPSQGVLSWDTSTDNTTS